MGFLNEIVAHVILLGFTAYVLVSADPGSSPFSWHPTCMILAWLLLNEGVLLFRKPPSAWRIAVHWALQASGLGLAIFGFLAIYRNKEDSGKPHFVTYHGLAGISTLILLVVTAAGGNIANFSVPISAKLPFVKPSLVKWGHRSAGSFAILALSTTVFLALFSFWFVAVTKPLLWYVIAAVVGYPLGYVLKVRYF